MVLPNVQVSHHNLPAKCVLGLLVLQLLPGKSPKKHLLKMWDEALGAVPGAPAVRSSSHKGSAPLRMEIWGRWEAKTYFHSVPLHAHSPPNTPGTGCLEMLLHHQI